MKWYYSVMPWSSSVKAMKKEIFVTWFPDMKSQKPVFVLSTLKINKSSF